MRYCSIDIETCGTDPDTCDILEFGAVLDDLKVKNPINSLPTFHCYFVLPEYKGQPYALSMHKNIFLNIAEKKKGYIYTDPMKFGDMFKEFLLNNDYDLSKKNNKVFINAAGKNFASFDLQFLNKRTNLSQHVVIRNRILDPSILFLDKKDEVLPSLSDCKKRAGLQELVSHDAVSDALDVIKLMRKSFEYKFF